jgi:hypothetical protein
MIISLFVAGVVAAICCGVTAWATSHRERVRYDLLNDSYDVLDDDYEHLMSENVELHHSIRNAIVTLRPHANRFWSLVNPSQPGDLASFQRDLEGVLKHLEQYSIR